MRGREPPTEALSWFRWNGFLFDSFQLGLPEEAQLQDLPQARAAGGQAALPLPRQALLRAASGPSGLRPANAGLRAPGDEPALRQHADPAGARSRPSRSSKGSASSSNDAGRESLQTPRPRAAGRSMFSKRRAIRPASPKLQTSPAAPDLQDRAGRTGADEGAAVADRKVREFLESQSTERRGELEHQALAAAAPFLRENYESRKGEGGPLFEECRRLIIHQHVMRLLAETGQPG